MYYSSETISVLVLQVEIQRLELGQETLLENDESGEVVVVARAGGEVES
jgi:hypothetical protein